METAEDPGEDGLSWLLDCYVWAGAGLASIPTASLGPVARTLSAIPPLPNELRLVERRLAATRTQIRPVEAQQPPLMLGLREDA